MIRVSLLSLPVSLVAAPAFAHEGAGIVHYVTQADHVAALIAAIALPVLFWLVLRAKRPVQQKQRVRVRKDRY
jgi:hypothetical protein